MKKWYEYLWIVSITYLILGMVTAFLISIISIKFLVGYIRNHSFTAFGWYRIILGLLVLVYFYF